MAELPNFDHLIVIPHLRLQNANAVSSPLTHGFPSITAFLGLMWALERKTRASGINLQLNAIGVVVHQHEEQVTQSRFVKSFRLTRNPNGKDGSPSAIIEEGRIHLELSLVLAVQGDALLNDKPAVAKQLRDLVMQMRVAGASVVASNAPEARQRAYVVELTGNEDDRRDTFTSATLRLLPGFVLVERHDLLRQRHQELQSENPQATPLDAWLSLSRINWRSPDIEEQAPPAKPRAWANDRTDLGWIVPIPVGYGALSDLQAAGSVANARDEQTPFRMVESLYSIGQWLSPHRLQTPSDLLWYADSNIEDGLYRCRNNYLPEPGCTFD